MAHCNLTQKIGTIFSVKRTMGNERNSALFEMALYALLGFSHLTNFVSRYLSTVLTLETVCYRIQTKNINKYLMTFNIDGITWAM